MQISFFLIICQRFSEIKTGQGSYFPLTSAVNFQIRHKAPKNIARSVHSTDSVISGKRQKPKGHKQASSSACRGKGKRGTRQFVLFPHPQADRASVSKLLHAESAWI